MFVFDSQPWSCFNWELYSSEELADNDRDMNVVHRGDTDISEDLSV